MTVSTHGARTRWQPGRVLEELDFVYLPSIDAGRRDF